MNKISILIADDHSLMRIGIRSMLELQPDFYIAGEAADGEAAVRMAKRLHPDVIVMDLMMPKCSGADATKLILRELPETKIVILSSFGTSDEMVRAIANGAVGALVKDSQSEELVKAIRTVLSGRTAISAELSSSIKGAKPIRELTEKQLAVLQSITRGLSNRDIAVQLGISVDTVKQHLCAIYQKLDVANRAEAITIAMRKQLLKV